MSQRRKYYRYKILVNGSLSWKKGIAVADCVLYNISQGGIGFISMETLSLSNEYTIRIKNVKSKFRGTITYEGKSTEAPKMKKYGLQFSHILSLTEIEEVLSEMGNAVRKDKTPRHFSFR